MPVTFLVNRNVQGLPQLASTILGTAATNTYATVADGAGNIYTCGNYTSTSFVNIINGVQGSAPSGTTCTLPISGSTGSVASAFLIKYNSSGSAQYSISVITSAASGAYNVILDPTGTFLYLVINYNNGVSTVNVTGPATNPGGTAGSASGWILPGLTNTAVSAIGIIKILASTGAIQWTASMDSTSAVTSPASETDYGLAVDSVGNLYLSGTYSEPTGIGSVFLYNAAATAGVSTISSYNLPALTTSAGISASFLVKFSSGGQAVFATPVLLSTTTNSLSTSFNCVIDPTNTYVYVVGSYTSQAATMPIYQVSGFTGAQAGSNALPISAGSAGVGNASAGFIIRYTTAGAYSASSTLGAAASATTYLASGNCQYYGLAIAPNGNIYVGGSYISTSSVTINNTPSSPTTTVTVPLQTTTQGVAVLVKYTPALVATYASVINPAATASTLPVIYSVAVDSSDVNVFIALRYSSTNAAGVNVSNYFTTATPGTSAVNLPVTVSTFTAMSMVRYFLGNPLNQITMQNTGTVNVPLSVTIDPSNTSLLMSTTYQNTAAMAVPNSNGTTAFSVVLTAAVQSGMFLKVS
jgi:hypothetical protein